MTLEHITVCPNLPQLHPSICTSFKVEYPNPVQKMTLTPTLTPEAISNPDPDPTITTLTPEADHGHSQP